MSVSLGPRCGSDITENFIRRHLVKKRTSHDKPFPPRGLRPAARRGSGEGGFSQADGGRLAGAPGPWRIAAGQGRALDARHQLGASSAWWHCPGSWSQAGHGSERPPASNGCWGTATPCLGGKGASLSSACSGAETAEAMGARLARLVTLPLSSYRLGDRTCHHR